VLTAFASSTAANAARVFVGAASDPSGTWNLYSLPTPSAGCNAGDLALPDYPQTSYDNYAIAVTYLRFCLLSGASTVTPTPYVVLLDKATVYAGTALSRAPAYDTRALTGVTSYYQLQPALPMAAADVAASATGGLYFAAQPTTLSTLLLLLAVINTNVLPAYVAASTGGTPPALCAPASYTAGGISKGIDPYPFDR
jgi:hypothetical protein